MTKMDRFQPDIRETAPMATVAAAEDLLFGLLALQNGLIDQAKLVAAFQAWTLDKSRSLAEQLVGRGDLDADDRAALEGLVARHLKKHTGDVEQSLAAIPGGRSAYEGLSRIGDPDIDATLSVLGTGPGSTELAADTDRTGSYVLGMAAAGGQRFRVLRPHATGGLGAVFVALDNELHREVALKQILDSHADDETSRTRFLLEAEITGGLEHPGIVPVYGLGTFGNGRPYYTMRFIRGDSLKEAIQSFHADAARLRDPGRRSLERQKLLRRFLDVCNAVDYAHSRGVLHRDIKPGNIIVGKHGETLIVDWGLAKATGKADPGGGERTLVPSSGRGSGATLPGSVPGHAGLYEPRASRGKPGFPWPAERRLQPGCHALLPALRQAAVFGRSGGSHPSRPERRLSRTAAGRCIDRQTARGGLPEGNGPQSRGTLRDAPGAGRGHRAMDRG